MMARRTCICSSISETILATQSRGRHSHVGVLDTGHGNSETLELSTTEMRNLPIEDLVELELVAHELLVVALEFAIEHLGDGHLSLDGAGDLVNILGLDEGLEVVLEDLREVVLELRATEVLEDLLPVWGILEQGVS